MASNQVSAMLFPERGGAPVLMPSVDLFRCLISGSFALVSSIPHMTRSTAHAFSVTFTTTAFRLQQLTAVWSLLLQADSEGPSFIFDTASCPNDAFLTQPRTDPSPSVPPPNTQWPESSATD